MLLLGLYFNRNTSYFLASLLTSYILTFRNFFYLDCSFPVTFHSCWFLYYISFRWLFIFTGTLIFTLGLFLQFTVIFYWLIFYYFSFFLVTFSIFGSLFLLITFLLILGIFSIAFLPLEYWTFSTYFHLSFSLFPVYIFYYYWYSSCLLFILIGTCDS